MNEDLLIALRDAHGGEDAAGGVGPDDQVDLVDGDQLLVEAARQLGLGLIIEEHPLDGPAEQAVALVQLLDVDLARDLVEQRRRREGARERQRAADADRRTGRRRHHAAGEGEKDDRNQDTTTRDTAHPDDHGASSSGDWRAS
jgi:hypothetical protein